MSDKLKVALETLVLFTKPTKSNAVALNNAINTLAEHQSNVSVLSNPTPNNDFHEIYVKVVGAREQAKRSGFVVSREDLINNEFDHNKNFGSMNRVQQCKSALSTLADIDFSTVKEFWLLWVETRECWIATLDNGIVFDHDFPATGYAIGFVLDMLKRGECEFDMVYEGNDVVHYMWDEEYWGINHEPDKTQKVTQGE